MTRIFETLRGLGYDAVRRYARSWRRKHAAVTAQAYVPMTFDPGEAYQFDWSHEGRVRAVRRASRVRSPAPVNEGSDWGFAS